MKFLLPGHHAQEVEQYFAPLLRLDIHAAANPRQRYDVTTIYTDTPAFSVYHRQGSGRRHKYRIRSYGEHGPVYLEQKSKQHGQVCKQRRPTSPAELQGLDQQFSLFAAEDWFLSHVRDRQLHPVVQVAYVRRPWFGMLQDQQVRLTFDSHLRARPVSCWSFHTDTQWTDLCTDMVVCEMKFLHALPREFRQAIAEFQLIPGGGSKYRRSIDELQLAPERESLHA